MLISNKLHSFRNFVKQNYKKICIWADAVRIKKFPAATTCGRKPVVLSRRDTISGTYLLSSR